MKVITKNNILHAIIGTVLAGVINFSALATFNDEGVISKTPAIAKEIYANVQKSVDSLLTSESDALTLDAIKEMMVGEGTNSQIAFERFYQAKKEIAVARAGIVNVQSGMFLGVDPTYIWSTYLILDIALSMPSNWYAYKNKKNLSKVEKYSYLSINENLKHLIAQLYYSILSQEVVVATADMEKTLTKKLMEVLEKKVSIGLSSQAEYEEVFWKHFSLENQLNTLKSIYNKEVSIFSTYLGKNPQEAQSLKLTHNTEFLSQSVINQDYNAYVSKALEKSNELKASHYRVQASKNAKKSSSWSVISFSGFGFGHTARVDVAKSKYSASKSAYADMPRKLTNQVYFAHSDLQNQISHTKSDEEIYLNSKAEVERLSELLEYGLTDLAAVLKAQIIFLQDFRKYMTSHYYSLVKLDQMERVVQGPVKITDIYKSANFELTTKTKKRVFRKGSKVTLKVSASADIQSEVESVTYTIDELGFEKKSSKSRDDFRVKLKIKKPGVYAGIATTIMNNGEVIKKKFVIDRNKN